MKFNRRDCLRVGVSAGAVAASGTLFSGCGRVVQRYTKPTLPRSTALPAGDIEPTCATAQSRAVCAAIRDDLGSIRGATRRGAFYIEQQLHPRLKREN
jgi:hypothetical protein